MNAKLQTLRKLRQLDGHPVHVGILLAELRLNGPIGEEELRDALADLVEVGFVAMKVNFLTKDRAYLITGAGKEFLAGNA